MSKNFLWASLLAVLIFTSCASRKNFVYLQDMEMGTKYPIATKYEAVIHDDDRLSITVSSKNPELAIPFNISGGSVQVGNDGSVSAAAAGSVKQSGYRVDVDGNIDFPILGKIHVAGMTVNDVKQLIREKLLQATISATLLCLSSFSTLSTPCWEQSDATALSLPTVTV